MQRHYISAFVALILLIFIFAFMFKNSLILTTSEKTGGAFKENKVKMRSFLERF